MDRSNRGVPEQRHKKYMYVGKSASSKPHQEPPKIYILLTMERDLMPQTESEKRYKSLFVTNRTKNIRGRLYGCPLVVYVQGYYYRREVLILKMNDLLHQNKSPCGKCPYTLGLVHTVANPCPQCKENDYQAFKQFQKQLLGGDNINGDTGL